jgi:hypothetical protein
VPTEDLHAYFTLTPVLTGGVRAELDALLVVDPGLSPPCTRHAWLEEGATSNTPKAIADQLEKLGFLRDLGADRFDVSGVNPLRQALRPGVPVGVLIPIQPPRGPIAQRRRRAAGA